MVMHTNLLRASIVLGLLLSAEAAEAATIIHLSGLPMVENQTVSAGESAPAMKLRLQADCSTSSAIGSITFVHEGTGALTDISDLTFTDGTGKRFESAFRGFDDWSKTATIRFLRPVEIAPCASLDLTATLSFQTTAKSGDTHTLLLEFPTDVTPSSTATTIVGNSLPVRGATLTVAASKKVTSFCAGGTAKDRAACRKTHRTKH